MKHFGFIKVAAAIPGLKVADCDYNAVQIKKLLQNAVAQHTQIVCFPELCITGYTCADLFFQRLLIDEAEKTVAALLQETAQFPITFILGAPVRSGDKLFNCALVCASGEIKGIVPKSFLPNYSEFYEKRWFHPAEREMQSVNYAGQTAPFGTKLLFCNGLVTFAVELCEDLWCPIPPSSNHALAGAQLLFNLSASNELAGKHAYLLSLINQQSARCIAGYVYASAGMGESTTDLVFGGNALIFENGTMLARSERFQLEPQLVATEIDVERLIADRIRTTSFRDSHRQSNYLTIAVPYYDQYHPTLSRAVNPHPFVPSESDRNESCREIFAIQTGGLAKRLLHTHAKTSVVGVSGGLDSTLALLVCAKTYDKIGASRDQVVGVTMPGFGTTDRTYHNAMRLMQSLGITIREIDIKPACEQHFKDIGHPAELHDVTFENIQARERTQILMDIANQTNGLVIGTGDLSELALGWATYNGDHISMYAVNSGVPKTLVRHLIRWVADTGNNRTTSEILREILDTPVSPELLPSENNTVSQRTEEIIGPYELHDFFLYYTIRFGFAPNKILFLANLAFQEKYEDTTIRKWLEVFFRRFFSQQFKRSCIPDGPKVGSINLSPRGDWRMPSDASVAVWEKWHAASLPH
jgi:NAD+ synthase (glutamine-hydrolysing)